VSPRLLSAARIGGIDGGALWSPAILEKFALPARGHAPIPFGNNGVALIARQPGTFGAVIDKTTLKTSFFKPVAQYRFGGHAAAHDEVAGFVTGEFHEESGAGLIVARDAAGNETTHWQADGIGPHDLVYTREGSRLFVALGG